MAPALRAAMLAAALPALFHAEPAEEEYPLVFAGREFSLFVDRLEGQVMAAGRNEHGQLGTGNKTALCPLPVMLPSDAKVVAAAAGAYHSLFLTSGGAVYATGRNHKGQLGDGTKDTAEEPIQILSEGVKAVAAGYAHSLFLMNDGTVMGTGYNVYGQLGDGTKTSTTKLTKAAFEGVEAIAAGYDFTYFLKAGEVHAVGNNLGGQLGDGTGVASAAPVKVETGSGVKAIAAGQTHGLFMMDSGAVMGTGSNFAGQLGDGTGERKWTPVQVLDGGAENIFVGGESSCFMKDGALMCMGNNNDGQLGLGARRAYALNPVEIAVPDEASSPFRAAALDSNHGLFLVDEGIVFASGVGRDGALGDCSANDANTLKHGAHVSAPTTQTSTTATSTTATSTASTATATVTAATVTATVTETTTTTADDSKTGQEDPAESEGSALPWVAGIGGGAVVVGGLVFFVLQRPAAGVVAEPVQRDNEVDLVVVA